MTTGLDLTTETLPLAGTGFFAAGIDADLPLVLTTFLLSAAFFFLGSILFYIKKWHDMT